MHPSIHFLAPLLALLPAANVVEPAPQAEGGQEVTIRLVFASDAISRPASSSVLPMRSMADGGGVDLPQQVSIEQRVTIRVAPRQAPMPPMMFEQDGDVNEPRFIERKFGKCIPLSGITSVQPVTGRKLLLTMRDSRLFSVELKKGCRARDFYSGFLVAKTADGMICKERDKLRARSGAVCEIDGFRQIIELGF